MKKSIVILSASGAVASLFAFSVWLGNKNALQYFIILFPAAILTWLGNEFINALLEKKYPLKYGMPKRIVLQAGSNALYTAGMAYLPLYLCLTYCFKEHIDHQTLYVITFISTLIVLMINAIYTTRYFFKKWKYTNLEAEQLKRENAESQLANLKNHINPHFFFNNLNTLAGIIPENPDLSIDFVHHLCNVYRYMFRYKDEEFVSISTELDYIRSYIFLLNVRFGNNLIIECLIPNSYFEHQIIPHTLQALIENAMRHNVISKANPLSIQIYIDKEEKIVVKNNLQKKKSFDGAGLNTLDKIISRYKLLCSEKVHVDCNTQQFSVILPLLTMEDSMAKL